MRSNERDDLDALLDSGLRGYANVEPRWGMEERIIRRALAGRRRRASRRWLVLSVALASAAVLIVAVRDRAHEVPASPVGNPVIAWEAPVRKPAPPVVDKTPIVRVAKRKKVVLPKRAQFPAPTRMTREERALVQLVTRYPGQALEIANALRDTGTAPIAIKPIQIVPLKNGS